MKTHGRDGEVKSRRCRSPRASLQTGRKLRVFRRVAPTRGCPTSPWLRLLDPPSFAAAGNEGGISSAAPVGSPRLHGGEVVIFVTWGAKNGQEWI